MEQVESVQNSVTPEFPPRTLFLGRERIHRLLAKAFEGSVLILSAGEGFGKTVAVSEFLRKRRTDSNRPVITLWHQVTGLDEAPAAFWDTYTREIGRYRLSTEAALRELHFPKTAREFEKWSEIARRELDFQEKIVIIMDDFHRLQSSAILDFINKTLSSPLPNHLLILICRGEPKLNIVPSVSKGSLTRIGAEELLFTKDETAAYFRLLGMELSPRAIDSVYNDTEGWPLLTGIAAAKIRKNGGSYRPVSLRGSMLRQYAENLFASTPEELQNYLIKLSLFEEWPVDLLRRTAGLLPDRYREISAMEAELEKLSLLIYHDYYLPGYRTHRIFRDYLREKQRELPFDEIREMSIIAARWYLENNLKQDAALHFERAVDYAGLIGIVDSFPHSGIPPAVAVPLLDIVERLINNSVNAADESLLFLGCVIRGGLLWCLSRFEEAAALFHENIIRFAALPPSLVNTRILAESWNYLGKMVLINRLRNSSDTYAVCFENAGHYYRKTPWPLPATVTVNYIGSYIIPVSVPAETGALEYWLDNFVNNIPRAANPLNSNLRGIEELGRVELAYFQGNLDVAEQYSRAAVIKGRENNLHEIEIRGLFYLMRIMLHRQPADGSIDEFIELWKQKNSLAENGGSACRNTIYDIIDGWLYIQLGEPEKVPSWLRAGHMTDDIHSIFRNQACLIQAKYYCAEKKYGQAFGMFASAENRETSGNCLLAHAETDCLKAAACYRMGDESGALAVLEEAYHAAVSNSITMPFIELGYDMRGLAGIALNSNSGIPRSWLEQTRRQASAYGKNLAGFVGQFRDKKESPAAVYLTRQEFTVLKSLSLGLTRGEIALETGQPLSTVKNTISNIRAKLGAVNRADAIRIASGLGLLGN